MPLGGYCSVCARWVWLTPYGECQNGHPASAVSRVSSLLRQLERTQGPSDKADAISSR